MFSIVTDTSANLPESVLALHKISVVPFHFFVNDHEETEEAQRHFDGKKFYDAIRAGAKVHTAQINPQQYIDHFCPILEKGQDILFVGMSSGISGSFNSAKIAIEELRERFPLRKIRAVDTLGASLGEGILVLKAADMQEKGKTLEEIEAHLQKMRERIYQVFTVDDLMHLRRTGRLSNAAAVVGSVLGIKPLLKGNDKGQIISFAKLRGRKKAIAALAEKYDAVVKNAGDQIVGIAHADAPEDAALLAELLRKNNPPKEIMTVDYEPVTGSHVGPGTVALFFEGDENARNE